MTERRLTALVFVVIVAGAVFSGGTTNVLMTDDEVVTATIGVDDVGNAGLAEEPVNETGVGSGNGTEPSEPDNATDERSDGDGIAVTLEPTNDTVEVGGTTTYEVVVTGASHGINGYGLRIGLSDPSVATFTDFEHTHEMMAQGQTVTDDEIDISAGAGVNETIHGHSGPNGTERRVVLGTVTVAGNASGGADLEIVDVGRILNATDDSAYEIGTTAGHGLTVIETNDPPTAENDSFSVGANGKLEMRTPELKANDGDPDGDGLILTLHSEPSNGTVTIAGDGTFVYEPDSGFTGEDTFVYLARDGAGGTDTATVRITVAS